MKYEIIKKTKEYIVINKPADVLVHGAEHIKEDSLTEAMLKDFPELAKVGEDPMRPGLVHRLDKLASGLMVIARTPESFWNLKEQFQKRTTDKFYTALVFGAIKKEEDDINFPIKRSAKGFRMAAIPGTVDGEKNEEGRISATHFEVIKRYKNFTLLKVKIKTGRTHQIRVHMAAYGHPLVGDDLYSTSKTRIKNKKLGLKRIFLVADRLEFTDLKGERKKFEIGLPAELENFLNNKIK